VIIYLFPKYSFPATLSTSTQAYFELSGKNETLQAIGFQVQFLLADPLKAPAFHEVPPYIEDDGEIGLLLHNADREEYV
jgi:hypothetical protein